MSGKQGRTAKAVAETRVEGELVDIEWVARRLGVSVRHVRRLVAERRIPYLKWGHLLRFDPLEIEGWIDGARTPCDELRGRRPSRSPLHSR